MAATLPESAAQSDVLYVSFRVTLVTLIDELMGETLQLRSERTNPECFLERFPLLKSMAPQVQLECLLGTWDRIQQRSEFSLLDEAVCLAASQTLSDLCLQEEESLLKLAWNGPRKLEIPLDHWVCSHVRLLQVALLPSRRLWQLEMNSTADTESQLSAMALSAAEQLQRNRLLDLVGRWRVSRSLPEQAKGLLTTEERDLIQAFFEEHRGLLA